MKKKFAAAILAAVVTISGSVPAIATPSDAELNEVRGKYEEIQSKVNDIDNKIYDLNVQIEPLQLKVDKNNKEIKEINNSIDTTTKVIAQTEEEIDTLDKALGQRVKALHDSGNLEFSYLSFIFESDSTSDFFARLGAVSKIIGKDKDSIKEIIDKKTELNDKKDSLIEKKEEIDKLTKEIQSSLDQLDGKKKEQEKLAAEAKAERQKFDSDYLSKVELEVVSSQFAIVDNSNSSISDLESVISQLRSIRDNQIKSPTVVSKINEKIESAKSKVANKKAAEEASRRASQAASAPSRGGTTSVNVPSASKGSVQSVLNLAYAQLGKPYVWGATGASTFDCSGFTQYVFRNAAGVDISRTTYTQINSGTPVSRSQLQPGDLVFTHAGHVGIYVGGGNMIHAPQTGDVVKVSPVYKFYAGRRVL